MVIQAHDASWAGEKTSAPPCHTSALSRRPPDENGKSDSGALCTTFKQRAAEPGGGRSAPAERFRSVLFAGNKRGLIRRSSDSIVSAPGEHTVPTFDVELNGLCSKGASIKGVFLRVNLLIAFLLITLSANGATGETPAGTLEGIVTFAGEVPKSATADDAGVRHDLIEVDKQTRGLRHAVLYLEGVAHTGKRGEGSARRESLTVDQVDYAFTPRVLAVGVGETVTFKNSDPANHNVRASGRNRTNEFNVFTGVDGKYEHQFVPEPNYHPVRLGCDIHPWMTAWVYVFDHPFFSVSDERGRFRIASVPPGEYKLHIVQPAIAHREQRTVRVIANDVSNLSVVVQKDAK